MRSKLGRGTVRFNRIIVEKVPAERARLSLLLASLFGGLGDFAGARILLSDGLDDTDGDRLPHVTDSEAAERRIFREGLHGHGLGWGHLDNSRIAVLDGFGESFQLFAGTTIAFLEDLFKLASNVGGVAIHDRCVSVLDFSRMVENNDLGVEVFALLGRVVLRIRSDVATTDFFDGDILNVETNVISRKSFRKRLMVHLHRFDLSGDVGRCETDHHTRFDDSSFNTAHGHCSDASDLVDILEGETKRLVGGARGGTMASRESMRVKPVVVLSLTVLVQPFSFFCSPYPPVHHAIFSDFSNMLSPCQPEMGQKMTSLGLYPIFLM